MVDDRIKDILLTKRISRRDPFGSIWIDEYFPELIDNLGISNTEIITCNTLQRRCCCLEVRGKNIILLDNYTLEIFLILNQFLGGKNDCEQIKALFYKITSESFFLDDNLKLALIYRELSKNKLKECNQIIIHPVTRDSEPRYIYVQQVFLVAHELMHSWFRSSPEEYLFQKNIINGILQRIFGSKYPHLVSSYDERYKEELCCDHIATYLAMDIGINNYKNSLENTAVSIMLALCHQFVIFCIDKWVADDFLDENISRDFNIRLTIVRAFINNFIKQYSPQHFSTIDRVLEEQYNIWKRKMLSNLTDYLVEQKLKRNQYNSYHIDTKATNSFKEKMRMSFSRINRE